MPRKRKSVWFRERDGWWYGQVGSGHGRRRQQRLAEGKNKKREAVREYRRLLEEGSADLTSRSKVKGIFIAFLRRHSKRKCSPETHAWYRYYLKSFAKRHGSRRIGELRPLDAEAWLAEKEWADTTRNRAVTCLKVALNWAVRMGVIRENPLKNLEKPPMGRRERILTPAERRTLFGGITDRAFKLFVFALVSTGARPSEVRTVTAKEFLKTGMWVFPPKRHKTGKKTQKPRVVYLTPPMIRLCERLARERPEGPLFRNSRGKPWTRNAVRCRFRYLRERLPQLAGVTAYCCRHTYVSDGLEKGIPLATMAELTGHTTTRMLEQHYSHLNAKVEHLRAEAARATRPRPEVRPPRPGTQ